MMRCVRVSFTLDVVELSVGHDATTPGSVGFTVNALSGERVPNISATVPQLRAAIKELNEHGYKIPDYPENPKDDAERALQADGERRIARERRRCLCTRWNYRKSFGASCSAT